MPQFDDHSEIKMSILRHMEPLNWPHYTKTHEQTLEKGTYHTGDKQRGSKQPVHKSSLSCA